MNITDEDISANNEETSDNVAEDVSNEETEDLKEKWNFSQVELAKYDLPAMLNKIVEVTSKPKVTYIGYSQGSFTMFYGLAEMEDDYFGSKVNKVIALAPCVYYETNYATSAELIDAWQQYFDYGDYWVTGKDILDQRISVN